MHAVLRGEVTELLPDDPRARQVHAATRTLAELLTGTPTWTPPDLADLRAVAQPHCHHHAVMGWHTDSALLASAGARSPPSADAAGCGNRRERGTMSEGAESGGKEGKGVRRSCGRRGPAPG